MRNPVGRLVNILALSTCIAATLVEAAPPAGFATQIIGEGFETPTAFAIAPDGELWVAEKAGRVWVTHGAGALLFLDLADEVNEYGDRGLLGLALDPDFESSGWVYLFYTTETDPGDPDSTSYAEGRVIRIQRSAADPHVADPLTRTILLDGSDNHHFSHSGGCLRFDAAGHLLASFGDGSSYDEVDALALATYDLDALVGKLVRVDRGTGDGVPGNPYYDAQAPAATRSKVIARGFRNPFRFGIDPGTGDVYVGDVGWDEWEEVARVPAVWTDADRDLNFGWPCYEGGDGVSLPMDGYRYDPSTAATCEALYPPPDGSGIGTTAALYAYEHSAPGGAAGSSVTGGAFYTGGTYPAQYVGRYVFADYARDRFQVLSTDGSVEDFGTPGGWGNPVDIQMAPSGNLAYLAIEEGAIREIVFDGGNQPPLAVATGSPLSGPIRLRVTFSAEQSSDPDGDRLSYRWDFGDGKRSRSKRRRHTYRDPGTYTVTLTVYDRRTGGLSSTATLTVLASNTAPTIAFVAPGPATTYGVGDALPIQIDASDPEDGSLGGASVTWQPILHHLGHLHYLPTSEGATGTFVVPEHGDDSFIELRATATDSLGATATASIVPPPRRQTVTIDAVPSGLTLIVDGQSRVTPYVWQSIEGGRHVVTAVSPQDLGGTTYLFDAWSDGLPASHDLVTPATPVTLTATYQAQ